MSKEKKKFNNQKAAETNIKLDEVFYHDDEESNPTSYLNNNNIASVNVTRPSNRR